jgi:hypothetical protein
MLFGIPASEAQVKTTDECKCVVDYNEFLMMCLIHVRLALKKSIPVTYPVKRHVPCILKDIVVRMPHDMDIFVSWRSLWT